MPVTQRFVHFGVFLAAALFAVSVCLLILGASRNTVTDAGLVGSTAGKFELKDSDGQVVGLNDARGKVRVLIISRIDSPLLAKAADRIRRLCDTFANDPNVRVLGIQFDPSAGMLDAASAPHGVMDPHCPNLPTLFDTDGAVARAYRVTDVPTLFVIDEDGVIRSREPLDSDGPSITTTETIASLRPQTMILTQPSDRTTPLSVTP